jgi:hypothetical protein
MSKSVAQDLVNLRSDLQKEKLTLENLMKNTLTVTNLNAMIREQCKKFPSVTTFDFRTAFNKNHNDDNKKYFLHRYLLPQLVQLSVDITKPV